MPDTGITLPVNPTANNAQVGKDFLVHINLGAPTVPDWILLGGQRTGDLKRTAEQIDTSSKTTDGWGSSKPGLRNWSVDLELLVLIQYTEGEPGITMAEYDRGTNALEQAFEEGKDVHLKYEYPDGSYREGWGCVTDLSISAPHDGEGTISATINGNGKLSKLKKA